MENPDLALRFAVAIGLGMLLGLERERTKGEEGGAGVRTFALIALSGAIAGYVGKNLGLEGLALAMFAAVAALILGMYVVTSLRGDTGEQRPDLRLAVSAMPAEGPDRGQLAGLGPPGHGLRVDSEHGGDLGRCQQRLSVGHAGGHERAAPSLRDGHVDSPPAHIIPVVPVVRNGLIGPCSRWPRLTTGGSPRLIMSADYGQ